MLKFRDLTSTDLSILSNELQFLAGARVRKVYQYNENEFRIKFSVPEKGSIDVAILFPYTIHITKQAKESPEPSMFVMTLRKYLENKKIEKAGQWNLDRVFMLEFPEHKLIIEFFGKGNVILTDLNNLIIASSRQEETKSRKINRGEIYNLPEAKRKFPHEISMDIYEEAIKEKEKDKLHLIAFLSKKINFPPFYWEEVLFRAKVEPLISLAKCDEKTFSAIIKHISEFIDEMKTPSPVLYSDGTYSIIPIQKQKEMEATAFSSFSDLMDTIYSQAFKSEFPKGVSEKKEKILSKIQHQKKHLEELLLGTEEKKKAGNEILTKENTINLMIDEYKKMKKDKRTTEEIEKSLSKIFGAEVKIEKGKLVLEIS